MNMKVLSLSQPWASLCFQPLFKGGTGGYENAAKSFETRGWLPGKRNQKILLRDGLLIHASETWKPAQAELLLKEPFKHYFPTKDSIPFGVILGRVEVRKFYATEQILKEWLAISDPMPWIFAQEKAFGDYGPNRFAWEFSYYHKFETPIPVKGKLSLWDFDLKEERN